MMRRIIVEVFSKSLIKLWKEGKVRALVLLSLTLQVILILLGNRRKHTSKSWIRITLWCAYLAADYVATVALGAILSNFVDVFGNNGAASLDNNIELTAFWAPFLLLHLGGPDTITAYSLEDNELWTRHLLGLVIQTAVAFYILIMSWTGSLVSVLSLLMIFAGLIKYGERTWVLRAASNEQLRLSSVSTLVQHRFGFTNLSERYESSRMEGYILRAEWVSAVHELPIDFSDVEDDSITESDKLVTAYGLIGKIKCLFLDVVLSTKDRDTLTAVFRNMSPKNAWEVISMELGFMFDILHTKAMIGHTGWGIAFRFISILLTGTSLVLFSTADKTRHSYSKVDLTITFLLLTVGIVLELYAALVQVSLDQTIVWLMKNERIAVSKSIIKTCLSSPLRNPNRWSNTIAQYSLLRYLVGQRVASGRLGDFKLISRMDKKLRIVWQYAAYHNQVSDDMKKWIFEYLQTTYSKAISGNTVSTILCSSRGTLSISDRDSVLRWSVGELEFEQSIIVWHIATELCYYLDKSSGDEENVEEEEEEEEEDLKNVGLDREVSKCISRYMMYLVAMSPKTLPPPTGVLGRMSLRDTCTEAVKGWLTEKDEKERTQGDDYMITESCRKLIDKYSSKESFEVYDAFEKRKKGWEASLLSKACQISSILGARNGVKATGQDSNANEGVQKEKIEWELISKVWMEMLAYAAAQCKGSQHAQQLTRGGELVTHVWIMMAHFGLTEHFKKQRSRLAKVTLI